MGWGGVKNRGKARIGGRQLRERFTKQVLKNRRIDPGAYEGMWLVFLGGLNSVGTPEMTNRHVSRIFRSAHDAGIHTMGLTLTPWGSERDKRRWAGAKGLAYLEKTRVAVDFVMGRLTPAQALGRYARGRESADWLPGELPEVSVELYDSPLRDAAAPLREETRARRSVMRVPSLRKQLRALPESEQEPWLSATLQRVREIPRWYIRPEYRGFDHIHPNAEGHKIIAQQVCASAPASWGCDCTALAQMRWDAKSRAIVQDAGDPPVTAP